MRRTRVISDRDRLRDAWITVDSGARVQIDARLGNRFRVKLGANATLEPPAEPHPGQEIVLRIEQDETGGRTLAVNAAGISTRGSLLLNTAALAVTVWRLLYDEDARLWDAVGVPDLSSLYDAAGAAAAAVAAIPSDGAAGTPSLRTLGTTSITAARGDDPRLTDSRAPTAHATSHQNGGSDVLFTQGSAIADVAGGATVDAEARTAINSILARLRAFPVIST